MPVTAASYTIKVRDPNLLIVGEIDGFDKLDMISRYNNTGSWVLTLADNHPMAPLLATPGYGIYVLRNGVYYFSGPVRLIDRQGIAANSLTVAGYDDMYWLAERQAYPGGFNTYSQWITFNNVLRAYAFSELVGSTATDFSPFTQNGTYTGTYTLDQIGGVDDPATAVLLGSNGYVSVPTSGLVAANQPFGDMVWFYYTAAPAATAVLSFRGTPSTASCVYMGILTTGKPTMQLKGTNYSGAAALTVGWHCMWINYDSTTARLYVDGVQVVTGVPGVCTVAYGVAAFGCIGAGASNFAQVIVQFGCFFQGNLGNASLSGSVLNGLPWPQVYYDLGLSLFNINQYDTQGPGAAESVIKSYVSRNLGPTAATIRQLSTLTIETDAAQGNTVTYNARFDQLLQMDTNGMLQILATAGGVGMKVIHDVTNVLIFKVFVPSVATKAKFSIDLGNLGAYEYIIDAQTLINAVVVGGGGTGTARAFYQTTDAASVALWGRSEGFINGGSATVPTQLQTQATAALASNAAKLTFNAEFYETDGVQYVRDFNLGDKVSVVIDGATLTDIVREVAITLDPANGETLKIGIGTPANGQIISALQKFQQTTAALNTRVTTLERV